MSPLSAIPPTFPTYDFGLQGGIVRPEVTPEVRMPLPAETPAPVQPASDSFSGILGRMVAEVNARQQVAADTVSALQSGQNVPLHQAVIAMEEAGVSFQLMVEVRNKLLDAYQELMRMQI